LEAEVEETETAAVAVKTVKMAEAIEMAAVTITATILTVKAAAVLKTAMTAESAEMVVADITDGKAVADGISEGTLMMSELCGTLHWINDTFHLLSIVDDHHN
jgi:hypothetical protein